MASEEITRLRQDKLQREIAKLDVETKAANLLYESMRQDHEDELAGPDHRHEYTFASEVGSVSVNACISVLSKWHHRDPGCDIKVVFSSPGGGVIAGFALYDFLRTLSREGHHVTTVARGMAASMAGVLLQAGDERVIDPNAHVLIHEVSTINVGKLSEIEDEVAFSKSLQDRLLNILAERASMTKEQIRRKWKKTDWWLNAETTLKLGFADRIG